MSYAAPHIYKDVKNDKGESPLATMVVDFNDMSARVFSDLREVIWRRCFLYWHSRHDLSLFGRVLQKYPWPSAIFMPTAFEQLEGAMPDIVEGTLASDPLVRLAPVIMDGEQEKNAVKWEVTRRRQALLNEQFEDDIRIRAALPPWARDVGRYGTCPLFVHWQVKRGQVWGQKKVGNDWRFDKLENDGILEDRIMVEGMPVWDLYPDPLGRSINGRNSSRPCQAVQRVQIINLDDMVAWVEGTPKKEWNLPEGRKAKIAELEKFTGPLKPRDDWHRALQQELERIADGDTAAWSVAGAENRSMKLIDHWEPDRRILVATNGHHHKVLLHEYGDERPYKLVGIPIVLLKVIPVNNELFGYSIIEAISGLVHEINLLVNLRNEDLKRSVGPLTIVDPASGITADELLRQPGGVHETNSTMKPEDAVYMQRYPPATDDWYQEVDYLHTHVEAVGGSSQWGARQPAHSALHTARGMGLAMQRAGARFNLMVRSLGDGLAELAETVDAINLQYMHKPRVVRVLGKDRKQHLEGLLPHDLNEKIRVYVDTRPSAINPGLEVQELINSYQIVGDWDVLDRAEAAMELFKRQHVVNPERLLKVSIEDADAENYKFLSSGRFGDVSRDENHVYHIDRHMLVWPVAQQRGAQAENEFDFHLNIHFEFAGLTRQTPGGAGAQQGAGQPMLRGGPPQGPPGQGAPPQGISPQAAPGQGASPMGIPEQLSPTGLPAMPGPEVGVPGAR